MLLPQDWASALLGDKHGNDSKFIPVCIHITPTINTNGLTVAVTNVKSGSPKAVAASRPRSAGKPSTFLRQPSNCSELTISHLAPEDFAAPSSPTAAAQKAPVAKGEAKDNEEQKSDAKDADQPTLVVHKTSTTFAKRITFDRQYVVNDEHCVELAHVYGMENQDDEDGADCTICYSLPKNIIFLPCRHISVCHVCLPHLQGKCPTCREPVRFRMAFMKPEDVEGKGATAPL